MSIVLLVCDVRVEAGDWAKELPQLDSFVASVLQAAAEAEGLSGSVDLLLTDNAQIQSLNAQWREKDKPTDVLSFPAEPGSSPPGGQAFLGDIALGWGVVQADAERLNRPLDLHMAHLLVHGFLHLAGYDHISPDDAKVMEGREASILARFGLPDPYGDAA